MPTAQSNAQENYTYEDLQNLLRTLNENGITLDEGSTLMQAFKAGHGYWEKDTIDEICRTAFGRNQGLWTLEQKHWYGEMMTGIGAWGRNIWLLPEGEEISLSEARALAVKTLEDAYGAELPAESNEDWEVYETFELAWQPETDSYPRENAQWTVWFSRRGSDSLSYDVTFDRFGQNAAPWRASFLEHVNTKDLGAVMNDLEERESARTQRSLETRAESGNLISEVSSFEKEPDSVDNERRMLTQVEKESAYQTEHGTASIYFLPLEEQAELFGGFHTAPSREEYDKALAIAEKAVASRYGADALKTLGDYETGVIHQENSSAETGEPQHVWDFMFTTDPTYLSDGYRVQFRYPADDKSGEETVLDLTVEHANLGNG